jgi:hypothetical protein
MKNMHRIRRNILLSLCGLLVMGGLNLRGGSMDTVLLTSSLKTVKQLLKSSFPVEHNVKGYLIITDDKKFYVTGLRLFCTDGGVIEISFVNPVPYDNSYLNPCIMNKKLLKQRIRDIKSISYIT